MWWKRRKQLNCGIESVHSKAMDLISKHTRQVFREHLVGWTLATIRDLFDCEDILCGTLPPELIISGQRRILVEEYYAGVDWSSPTHVRKILSVYESILTRLETPGLYGYTDEKAQERELQKLLNFLKRDGYTFQNGHLHGKNSVDLTKITAASKLVDRLVLTDHLRRIDGAIETDPALAVGSAKELLETVAKQILEFHHVKYDQSDSIQQLVKGAMTALNLSIEGIPEAAKGANSLKQILAGLNQIVGGVAELRNLYGTGHGRTRSGGLKARHARLVVGAVSTLAVFLLETLEDRKRAATVSTTISD
jgi:hypothetical protein